MKSAIQTIDITALRITPLANSGALRDFSCGEPEIDQNLAKCGEWHSCHRSRVYCASLLGRNEIYGFYCLGLHAHRSEEIGEAFERSSDDVRSYVPFIYINYLAVRAGFHRQKIGQVLLLNALGHCASVIRRVGSYGVALTALNGNAAALYDKYGFRCPVRNPPKYPLMVLPAQSVLDLFPA